MLNFSFNPMLNIVVGFEENSITIRSLYPTTDQLSSAERQLRSYCYKVSTIDDDENTESTLRHANPMTMAKRRAVKVITNNHRYQHFIIIIIIVIIELTTTGTNIKQTTTTHLCHP